MIPAQWIKFFSRHQQLLAEKLDKQSQAVSAKKRKLILMLFCFVFGATSIFIMVRALYSRREASDILQAIPATIPYHIGKNLHQPGAFIDEKTFERVERFKLFLDSLKVNNPGRYTEIMNTRPHLVDSIVAFDNLYHLQSKK